MASSIFPTTAEDIIGATDAILQQRSGVNAQLIADFQGINLQYAENAAKMAVELGLASFDPLTNLYSPESPFASYLVTNNPIHKAAVLRFVLEQFDPYQFFKNRLVITDFVAEAAATQTKAILTLNADRTEISSAFINLGTYTGSLNNLGAGRYEPNKEDGYKFLETFAGVIGDRESARMKIRSRLGEDISQWIDTNSVFEPLVDALQSCENASIDPRPPIVHAGNAVESFLVQVAALYNVNIHGKHGINSKIIEIITTQHHLTKKHLSVVKYLGDVRNAADHGIDQEIGSMWTISSETAVEYFQVSLSSIRSIYDCIHGNYII